MRKDLLDQELINELMKRDAEGMRPKWIRTFYGVAYSALGCFCLKIKAKAFAIELYREAWIKDPKPSRYYTLQKVRGY